MGCGGSKDEFDKQVILIEVKVRQTNESKKELQNLDLKNPEKMQKAMERCQKFSKELNETDFPRLKEILEHQRKDMHTSNIASKEKILAKVQEDIANCQLNEMDAMAMMGSALGGLNEAKK